MTDPCQTCNDVGFVTHPAGGLNARCPDCARPQPDTAPEGPWTVEHNTVLNEAEDAEIQVYRTNEGAEVLAERLAAALNGASATDSVTFSGPDRSTQAIAWLYGDDGAHAPALYEGTQRSAYYHADKDVTRVVIEIPGYSKGAFNDHRAWDNGVRVVAIDHQETDS